MTLVIMAAGMGSRFGGLKQIEPIDEYGNFITYLYKFAPSVPIYETNKTNSLLSDEISKDLKKRGMKFVGTTIIYSYLQAIGIINSHEKNCFMYKEEKHA